MGAGQPTNYDDKFVEEVDLYLESCNDTEDSFVTFSGEKGDGYQRTIEVNLPTLEGFAEWIRGKYENVKCTTSSIWNWENSHPEFLEATTRIRNVQAMKLMNGTLSGKYEKSMAQLILRSQSRHYQPIEKSEVSGKDGGAIQTESNLSPEQVNTILGVLNEAKK